MSRISARVATVFLSTLITACGGGSDAGAAANQNALSGSSGSVQAADTSTQTQTQTQNQTQNQTQTSVTMSLADLPYKDPQPLVDMMAMNDADYQNQLSSNWPTVENMLQQYIPPNVQLYPVPLGFYGPMDSCLQQHGLAACREYMNSLIGLMRSKQPSGT